VGGHCVGLSNSEVRRDDLTELAFPPDIVDAVREHYLLRPRRLWQPARLSASTWPDAWWPKPDTRSGDRRYWELSPRNSRSSASRRPGPYRRRAGAHRVRAAAHRAAFEPANFPAAAVGPLPWFRVILPPLGLVPLPAAVPRISGGRLAGRARGPTITPLGRRAPIPARRRPRRIGRRLRAVLAYTRFPQNDTKGKNKGEKIVRYDPSKPYDEHTPLKIGRPVADRRPDRPISAARRRRARARAAGTQGAARSFARPIWWIWRTPRYSRKTPRRSLSSTPAPAGQLAFPAGEIPGPGPARQGTPRT